MRRCCRLLWFAPMALWLMLPVGTARAADGDVVARREVLLSEDEVSKIESQVPDIRTVLATVEIQAITYLSDGLRVNGFLAVPCPA